MGSVFLMQESNNFQNQLKKALKYGYSGIAAPINCTDVPLGFDRKLEFTYSDLLLTANEWRNKVILMLSDNIDCDSNDEFVRKRSLEVLQVDFSWAQHLQANGRAMIQLKSKRNTNLARLMSSKYYNGFLLVKVPMYNAQLAQAIWRRDVEDLERLEEFDPWHLWNDFRWATDFNDRVKVVLEVHEHDVPSIEVVRRWMGEPIEAIILPSTIFVSYERKYPTLPKAWQDVLSSFIRLNISLYLWTNSEEDENLKSYAEYLKIFMGNHKGTREWQALEDIPKAPLQPLYDNLDANTYEEFERDPVKYRLYQDAIEAALQDMVSEEEKENKLFVLMVLGAGRGPLVRAALNAAKKTERKVRIYIIEKNPNAVQTLTNVTRTLWHNEDVHIFSEDMREFSPPEKADIIISELLGSFGDNELSPECLDCAEQHLKPGGVSIPRKSTSYINPIMSSTLFNNIRQLTINDPHCRQKRATYFTNAESSYGVLLTNVYNIARPQMLFEFEHPNQEKPIDNSRYKVLRFNVTLDCVLNGIAGYFDAVLYKDISLSINPETYTKGLFSWFPIYFPFTEPINVQKGQVIEVHFWRCVSGNQIWYEWCLKSPKITHVHNLGGRSCAIQCT